MYGLIVLRRLTAQWVGRMMTFAFPVALFGQWLVRSVSGTLTLVAALWLYRWHFSDVRPWTLDQLAIWISELDSDLKGAILTAMLTVIGFTVAFQTAAEAWKIQALGQLKLRLADEIEKFFAEASSVVIDLGLYAERVVEVYGAIAKEGLTDDNNFTLQRVLDSTTKFVAAREKLSRISIEVHGISGRNLALFSGIPGAPEYVADLTKTVEKLMRAAWIPVPPLTEGDRAQNADAFVRYVDVEKYRSFAETCDIFRPVINGVSGGLTGVLRSTVIRPNVHTFLYMLKNRSVFLDAFSKLDEAKKR